MHIPWLIIKKFNFFDLKKTGLKKLNQNKFKTSPWINDIVNKNNFNLKNIKLPIKLIKIKVKDLGFKKPVQLKKIYIKANLKKS